MLDETKLSSIIKYCKSKAPFEAGGYINRAGGFIPLVNRHDEPERYFRFPDYPADEAVALIHSHPGGPFAPSEYDQRQQYIFDVPWGIVAFDDKRTEFFWFGDSAPIPPLIGRGFRHKVTDCFAAVRDLYRVHCDVTIPDMVREWDWWRKGGKLWEEHHTDVGFYPVPSAEIAPGDVILMQFGRAPTPNHSAVWLGDSLIYHHVSGTNESDPSRLAVAENVGPWTPKIKMVLRHENRGIARAAWPDIRKKLQP